MVRLASSTSGPSFTFCFNGLETDGRAEQGRSIPAYLSRAPGPIFTPLDHPGGAGLLWAINGGRLVELYRDWAVIDLPVKDRSECFTGETWSLRKSFALVETGGSRGRVRGQPIGAPIAIEPKGAAWPMVCCVQCRPASVTVTPATPAAGGVLA